MRTSETIVHDCLRLASSGSLATAGPRRIEPRGEKDGRAVSEDETNRGGAADTTGT